MITYINMFYGVVISKEDLSEMLGDMFDENDLVHYDSEPDPEFPFDFHQLPHDIDDVNAVVGVWVATTYSHDEPTFINTDLITKINNATQRYTDLLQHASDNIKSLMAKEPKLYSVADGCQRCCT